ncbi:hypothetical protein ATY35_16955 [Vibrio cidicii]|uniref:Phosphoenolpyruvate protein kinase n=1 Tax=Vibrio cidicii TaxID=1763883 RepID=A0ABR5W0J2_9VIBR|nr:nitrate/nitrite transporter NrtS [Vibrio cidicii]KYN85057.1 hypothetical protein ATY35_16955 [Vibrio cidicii]HDB1447937.1 nitrate/nitrite transporter NrtS [Vibrio cholerae]
MIPTYPLNRYFRYAVKHGIFLRSFKVAAIVGTVLMLINHGDRLLYSPLEIRDYVKMGLTYLVPFCVSTHASLRSAAQFNQEGLFHDESL